MALQEELRAWGFFLPSPPARTHAVRVAQGFHRCPPQSPYLDPEELVRNSARGHRLFNHHCKTYWGFAYHAAVCVHCRKLRKCLSGGKRKQNVTYNSTTEKHEHELVSLKFFFYVCLFIELLKTSSYFLNVNCFITCFLNIIYCTFCFLPLNFLLNTFWYQRTSSFVDIFVKLIFFLIETFCSYNQC